MKQLCGANFIDGHVQEHVLIVTQGQWSQVDESCAVNQLLHDHIWYDDRGPRVLWEMTELVEGTYA